MDAAPPSLPPPPAAYVYAATDERPRTPREIELCDRASRADWLYIGSGLVLDVAAIWLDGTLKYQGGAGLHYLGSGSVGLAWGFTLGGGYLALPKCSRDWVPSPPPEGDVRADWPIAASIAALAGVMSPFIVGEEIGVIPQDWSVGQRTMRLVFASTGGVVGALVPYLVPPKTWRAAMELRDVRAGATDDGRGAFVSLGFRF